MNLKTLAREYLDLKISQEKINNRLEEIRTEIADLPVGKIFNFKEGRVSLATFTRFIYSDSVRKIILDIKKTARDCGDGEKISRTMFFYTDKSSKKPA